VARFAELERDLGSIRLPRWGRVVPVEGVVPWLVVDLDGEAVEPIQRFLRDFVAGGNRMAIGVDWDKATSAEVKDFVLWLGQAAKPRNSSRTRSIVTVGTVNAVTRKRYLGDQYEPRTVRHGNAVLRSFYEFWIELGAGPLVNPVVLDRRGRRPNEHHNPLVPFRAEGRIRYNPKVPQRKPRAMPDERWNELFAALRSNRDRAILALGISNGARASELLGVRGADLDWGEQLVRVPARAPARSSGYRPARKPSCGSGCTWLSSMRWSRMSPCGGRCAAATTAAGCGVSR
jgi:hypothetical protein